MKYLMEDHYLNAILCVVFMWMFSGLNYIYLLFKIVNMIGHGDPDGFDFYNAIFLSLFILAPVYVPSLVITIILMSSDSQKLLNLFIYDYSHLETKEFENYVYDKNQDKMIPIMVNYLVAIFNAHDKQCYQIQGEQSNFSEEEIYQLDQSYRGREERGLNQEECDFAGYRMKTVENSLVFSYIIILINLLVFIYLYFPYLHFMFLCFIELLKECFKCLCNVVKYLYVTAKCPFIYMKQCYNSFKEAKEDENILSRIRNMQVDDMEYVENPINNNILSYYKAVYLDVKQECPISYEDAKIPVIVKCGHIFNRHHLDEYIRIREGNNSEVKCPTCSVKLIKY